MNPPPATPPAAIGPPGSVPLPTPNQLSAVPLSNQLPSVPPNTPSQPLGLPGPTNQGFWPGAVAGNPHQRTTPTNAGANLALGPNEMPLDRALEIIKRLDELIDENKRLQVRIKTLEANGLSREDAVRETLREVERATEEVVKTRTDIQGLRAEVTALRSRVKEVEASEVETLQKVIAVLEKVLEANEK
ncbi:MAG: hypothetical protein MUF18_06470 [Fimbriiglobus sp.]|nr:hypothetical protein [Fimbriiglobus sp.]